MRKRDFLQVQVPNIIENSISSVKNIQRNITRFYYNKKVHIYIYMYV